MLTKSRLEVFRKVVMGASTASEIADALGISERAVYTHLSALRSQGLLATKGISVPPVHHARMLALLVMRGMRWGGSASLLLTEAGMKIALTAWRPLARSQILRQSGLPRRTFDRWFSRLLEARALIEVKGGYVARPWAKSEGSWGILRELLSGYMSYLAKNFQERGTVVVWTNGWQAILIAKRDLDLPLTAFSAFHLYGVSPLLARREYALPARRLTIQDIYDHACLLAEDPREEELCMEFYEANRERIRDERREHVGLEEAPINA